ncbi:MAG: hypothetical protein BroJett040_24850 [Oligoflexia bacterium]|nr:MAG: hypothetical protein BroJett040_24850 [Oligoflexia bacterium]
MSFKLFLTLCFALLLPVFASGKVEAIFKTLQPGLYHGFNQDRAACTFELTDSSNFYGQPAFGASLYNDKDVEPKTGVIQGPFINYNFSENYRRHILQSFSETKQSIQISSTTQPDEQYGSDVTHSLTIKKTPTGILVLLTEKVHKLFSSTEEMDCLLRK